MKKSISILLTFLAIGFANAQPVKFTYNNSLKVLGFNPNDTLVNAFVGGLNAPQFSSIDLNGDGILDLFVFDRVGNKILTFIKTPSGFLYEPKYEKQFPPLNNWVILKDYNCDGLVDIFTEVNTNVQPDKSKPIFTNGIRVIKNLGKVNGKFTWQQTQNQLYDTGSFGLPPSNIAFGNTDLPGIVDIDNDGDLDLLFFPLGKNIITYYQNMSKEMGYNCDSLIMVFRDEAWGYMYYKVNDHGFVIHDSTNFARNYPQKAHGMHNGATFNFVDMDGDGDKDLLYGDVGFNSLIYLQNGKTINSKGRDSIINQVQNFPSNTVQAAVEIFPAAFFFDADNDQKIDMLVCPNAETGAKNTNQILFYKNTGTNNLPIYTYQNNTFLLNQMVDLGGGAFPTFVDIDQDGDEDIVIATQGEYTQTFNSDDRLVLYKNIGTATNAIYQLADTNFLNINIGSNKINRIKPTFGDLNGDGKPDLIIGDNNGQIHYYTNASVGQNINFTLVTDNLNQMYGGTFAAPQLFDLNKDGKLDIVMGRKNGSIAYFQNNGTTTNPQFTQNPTIDSLGKITVAQAFVSGNTTFYFDGYSNPVVCDLDNDGKFEMLVGSDQGKVFLFTNVEPNPNKTFAVLTDLFIDEVGQTPFAENFGFKSAPAVAKISSSAWPDLMVGNTRGGLRYYKTTVTGVISSVKNIQTKLVGVSVYPNPTNNLLNVDLPKSVNHLAYSVLNISGQKLLSGEILVSNQTINLETLNNGLYFIQILEPKTGLQTTVKIVLVK